MKTIEIKAINTEDLQKEISVNSLIASSKGFIIKTQDDLDLAGKLLVEVKQRYKELEKQRKSITSPIDDAKKAVMDLFRQPLTMLENAESYLKKEIIRYDDRQKEIARQEQIRLQRLAEQEAEKQKKLLDAKIQRAEASGKVEKVEELLQQKENIAPIDVPVIAPEIEKPKGISYRDMWTAEVIDINLIPREYMVPNMQALNKVAQATKGSIIIPGVKFKVEKIIASRS